MAADPEYGAMLGLAFGMTRRDSSSSQGRPYRPPRTPAYRWPSAAGSGPGGSVLQAAASPPQSRVAMTSDLLIALYVGHSVPVIGAGVALDLGVSAPDTVLGFAILVGLGVSASGWALLVRRR